MKKLAPKISEATLQVHCVRWFKIQFPKYALRIFHPANGGSRNPIEAANLKKQGVLPGVCDVLITIPRNGYGGLFCELKAGRNGLSEHQEAFIAEHEQDYSCHVVRSLEEFQTIVNEYLNNNQ